jgi:adenylyltransferase/sulfurtransferase
MFRLTADQINSQQLRLDLFNQAAGALVVFEGWVRDHNQGSKVTSLEYEAYPELCQTEAQKIMQEARDRFNLTGLTIVHRSGHLQLQDIAVWIGATAHHRDDAFKAARFCIDQIKLRLPIWKREHYTDREHQWVFCRDHAHHVHFESKDYYSKQSKMVDQNKLAVAKVLVIGAGGLGCPVLQSLTSAGVGEISIVDHDRIEISNIHRQPLYAPNLVGEFKAVVAQKKMQELNPYIKISATVKYVDASNILELCHGFDMVLDCTDNLVTKGLINHACHNLKIPFVTASIYKNSGTLRTVIPTLNNGCSQCFKSPVSAYSEIGNCNDFGVLGAHVAILGSMQASQALVYLNQSLIESAHSTFLFDFQDLSWSKIKNAQDDNCSVCASSKSDLEQIEITHDELSRIPHKIIDLRYQPDFNRDEIKQSKETYVFQCFAGNLSGVVVRGLRAQGLNNCFSLQGGAKHP